MEKLDGFIFSKLHLIGTKSEGPKYYLQQFDYSETEIKKQSHPWMEDKNIQKHLGKKVSINGEIESGIITYKEISEYQYPKELETKSLELGLSVKKITMGSINKLQMDLSVEWPYRSIWQGICPTSKKYDFYLFENEELLCSWSDGRVFCNELSVVKIPGGSPKHFFEEIAVSEVLDKNKKHKVKAVFIASNQEIEKEI